MNLHCPSCGSSNTQNIEIAYEHSVRTSHNGYESVSAFGQSIAPPKIVNPFFAGFLITLLWLLFWFIGLITVESYRWFKEQDEWHVFLFDSAGVVFVIGLVATSIYDILAAIPARAEWRQAFVCRRCGQVWTPEGGAR